MEIEMTTLGKTWILDLDGTLLKHNGYMLDGADSVLKETARLLSNIKREDMVIIITSRERSYKDQTEKFLRENGIRFDKIIYGAPYGERILINDDKPSGRRMAYAIGIKRDELPEIKIIENETL